MDDTDRPSVTDTGEKIPSADPAWRPPAWIAWLDRWGKRAGWWLGAVLLIGLVERWLAGSILHTPLLVALVIVALHRTFTHMLPLVLATVGIPLFWLWTNGDLDFTVNRVLLMAIASTWLVLTPWIRAWVQSGPLTVLSVAAGWRTRLTWSLAGFVAVWLVVTALRPWARNAPPALPMASAPPATSPTRHIGLALSGGGYRAALFHAGVVAGLERFGVAPTHLSSVSGGSIFASYYVAGGRPDDFVALVLGGHLRLMNRLTYADTVIPLLFSLTGNTRIGRTRSELQENVLNAAFLRGVALSDLQGQLASRWVIGATDIRRGWAVGMMRGGLLVSPGLRASERMTFTNAETRSTAGRTCFLPADPQTEFVYGPLSRAVVASGAFPVAFNAVPVRNGVGELALVDGGLSDNTGIKLLLSAHHLARSSRVNTSCGEALEMFREIFGQANGISLPDWKLDLIISADASAPLRPLESLSWSNQLGQVLDTIYTNAGFPASLGDAAPKSVLLNPSDLSNYDFAPTVPSIVPASEMTSPEEFAGKALRTGLDRKLRVLRRLLTIPAQRRADVRQSIERDMAADVERARGAYWSSNLFADEQMKLLLAALSREGVNINDPPVDLMRLTLAAYEVYLASFLRTGTLEDAIDDDRARHIFRLGRLLVALNLPAFEAEEPVERSRSGVTRGD